MSPKKLSGPLVWAEISLKNLRHNLQQIRRHIGPRVEVMAIVKADAYGHGMAGVARELRQQGISFFGVANIDEARELLKVVPGSKVLVLGAFHPDQLGEYLRLDVRPTLSSLEEARLVSRAVLDGHRRQFPVHVKIDTGMGRLGAWHEEAEELFRFLAGSAGAYGRTPLRVEGIYTHFASADRSRRQTNLQVRDFNRVVSRAKKIGLQPLLLHAANSMGVARFRHAHLNLVRPGILLYGINPGAAGAHGRVPLPGLKLKPVLSLKAKISFLKSIPRGRAVSYGSTFRAAKNTTIAVLPIGYSHGYRVGFSNRAHVLIRQKRCPVAGRVTMDQTLIDTGSVKGIRRWESVTLIGREGKEQISAEFLASLLSTIPYEVVCGIHSRVPRIFVRA